LPKEPIKEPIRANMTSIETSENMRLAMMKPNADANIILKKSFINLCPIVIICTKIGQKELYCN